MLRLLAPLAALVALIAPTGRAAPPPPQPVCTPLPASLLGEWQRSDDSSWRLRFSPDCTYQATERTAVEGSGNYTLSAGDESAGTFVFSNDTGCDVSGVLANDPTSYDYTYARGVFALTPAQDDLCYRPSEPAGGRAGEFAGHGGWIRPIRGTLRLSTTKVSTKTGSFSARGAFADQGRYAVRSSRSTRTTTKRTLRFTGTNGVFTLSERISRKKHTVSWALTGNGSDAYAGMAGSGKGTARGSRQTLHGAVSN